MDFGKPCVFPLGARAVLVGASSCVGGVEPFTESERFLSADCFDPVAADRFYLKLFVMHEASLVAPVKRNQDTN